MANHRLDVINLIDLIFFSLDSFHVGDRWPNVTTADSWSREFITESPAILFKRKDDATDLKHLSFNVLTDKSFTICGIDWNVEGNIAETENNEHVADTIGHTIGGSPVNGADSVKPVSLLFKIFIRSVVMSLVLQAIATGLTLVILCYLTVG